MKIDFENIIFEDIGLKKACSDYMYTRDMTDGAGEPGPDDLACIALRYLKQHGKLDKVDRTRDGRTVIKINVQTEGENEAWLLMMSTASANEHKSDPRSASERLLRGCITDALTGRAYPYAAMRVTGSGDPLEKTKGLVQADSQRSQKEIVSSSAEGFSEYARMSGIPVGAACEVYHPGFAGDLMESAAVISAAPAVNMRHTEPEEGDQTMMLSCDGDSYIHRVCRLIGDGEAAGMIKCCSTDEDGRISCLVAERNSRMFSELAEDAGLECVIMEDSAPAEREYDEPVKDRKAAGETDADTKETPDAKGITETPDIAELRVRRAEGWQESYLTDDSLGFAASMKRIAEDLCTCSGRGLAERFDSTVGRRTVMMPLSGANQLTPMQAAVHKIPVQRGETDDCSLIAWGYNPYITEASAYHGAYLAVVESIAKLAAAGASFHEVYISILRNFPGEADGDSDESAQAGAEIAALLGAFEAEMGLGVPSIGSSTCEQDMPALVSYALTMGRASELISPEFKGAGHRVIMLRPETERDPASAYYGLPAPESLRNVWRKAYELIANGRVMAAYTPGMGGAAEAVMKMSFGGGVGFEFASENIETAAEGAVSAGNKDIFGYSYGSIILEMSSDEQVKPRGFEIVELGRTCSRQVIARGPESVGIGELLMLYEGRLEGVYAANADSGLGEIANIRYAARSWHTPIFKRTSPKLLIPTCEGMAGEDDLAKAAREAGASAEILVLKAGSEDEIRESAERLADAISSSQILMPAGGMSRIMREEIVADKVEELLRRRDGLICGIGEGFKLLVDLGLLPYGDIIINTLGAHQSRIAKVCVASNKSPWLRGSRPGEVYNIPISTTYGRFVAADDELRKLAVSGQIATQYVDDIGRASADIRYNPSGSYMAVEGITSEDGRVLGRMGRVERAARGLHRNVPGSYMTGMFENAVRYFK